MAPSNETTMQHRWWQPKSLDIGRYGSRRRYSARGRHGGNDPWQDPVLQRCRTVCEVRSSMRSLPKRILFLIVEIVFLEDMSVSLPCPNASVLTLEGSHYHFMQCALLWIVSGQVISCNWWGYGRSLWGSWLFWYACEGSPRDGNVEVGHGRRWGLWGSRQYAWQTTHTRWKR